MDRISMWWSGLSPEQKTEAMNLMPCECRPLGDGCGGDDGCHARLVAHFDGPPVKDPEPLDPEVSARLMASGWHTRLDVSSGALRLELVRTSSPELRLGMADGQWQARRGDMLFRSEPPWKALSMAAEHGRSMTQACLDDTRSRMEAMRDRCEELAAAARDVSLAWQEAEELGRSATGGAR